MEGRLRGVGDGPAGTGCGGAGVADRADPHHRHPGRRAEQAGGGDPYGDVQPGQPARPGRGPPSLRAQANDWYRSLLLGGAFESERGKRVRLAFLAATGAFFLRSFGIMEISEAEWKTFNEDIARLLPADASAP
ncbi:hypothetical protein [Pseudomonas solani]|uniref:hypothetical protein n=1 Tax=Pseudomonas solani TaxID=2731552 RepID=UPI0035BE2FB2